MILYGSRGYALHRRTPKGRTRHWGRRHGSKMGVDGEMANARKDAGLQFPEIFGEQGFPLGDGPKESMRNGEIGEELELPWTWSFRYVCLHVFSVWDARHGVCQVYRAKL